MFKNNLRVMKGQIIALCVLSFTLYGCATMLAPGKDEVAIKTDPAGADVYDGVIFLGKTPLRHTFDRETFGEKILTIKMKGHKSQTLELKKTLEEKALFNFIFSLTTMGATSWGIDAVTGNMTKYAPNSYLIELEKEKVSSNQNDPAQRQRLRFAILNHAYIRNDIARGSGEYLKAYYEIMPSAHSFDSYEEFLGHVSNNAQFLLALNDPVDFYVEFEKSLASIQISQNR